MKIKPMLYIGIMITKETPLSRINAFRKSFLYSTSNVIFKYFFVIGKGHDYQGEPDILELDIEENMNDGKTYQWFLAASKMLKNETNVHELSGIVKMDTDCAVNWTKLDMDIFSMNVSKNISLGDPILIPNVVVEITVLHKVALIFLKIVGYTCQEGGMG